MLRDKGVIEFVEAARLLKARGVKARFVLVGDPDPGNPNSVTQAMLDEWDRDGVIEAWGFRSDISAVFAQSAVVALLSYREGLPKVLIEAAACGRPVVTTNNPGCRDAVEPDKTGLLVPVRDTEALAMAIQKLLQDPEMRRRMGEAGRALAEREFAVEKIVDAHMKIYQTLLS